MVVDLLARSSAGPDDIAVVTRTRSYTYGDLDALVEAAAAEVEAGDAVVEIFRPTVEGAVRLLAAWRVGRPVAPLHPAGAPEEHLRARAALDGVAIGEQAVLWTSGTSGRPRGIVLSFENLAASASAAADRLSLGAGDRWLASLSLAHVGGLALLTRSILLGGAVVLDGGFDAGSASRWIDGEIGPDGLPATHVSLVPTQLTRLLDARADRPPSPAFRVALIGGAHAPAGLVDRALAAGWPLALTYGASEMTSQIATATPDEVIADPTSVGKPLPGVEVRIGSGGEIECRGPTLATGALEAAADGWRVGSLAGGDGWYATGDFGRLDERGVLRVTGRVAERIVSGGVTVSAIEVEDVLLRHPAVSDACVVGVPDEEWGERVVARIEGVEGELDLDDLTDFAASRLSPAKRPRRYSLGTVPRNRNGKADRDAVRRAFQVSESVDELRRGREPAPGVGDRSE